MLVIAIILLLNLMVSCLRVPHRQRRDALKKENPNPIDLPVKADAIV